MFSTFSKLVGMPMKKSKRRHTTSKACVYEDAVENPGKSSFLARDTSPRAPLSPVSTNRRRATETFARRGAPGRATARRPYSSARVEPGAPC